MKRKVCALLALALSVCLSIDAQTQQEVADPENGSEICDIISEPLRSDSIGNEEEDSPWRKRGYRAYFDAGMMFGESYGWNFTTSHGYQFNPYFYVGVGASLDIDWFECVALPVFVNARVNFIRTRVTPFLDIKGGYSITSETGGYFSPSVGVSVALAPKFCINASVGYNMQMYNDEGYGYYNSWNERYANHNISFKVGIDF